MSEGGMNILIKVNETIFVFVCCDEKGTQLLLREMLEDLSDFLSIHVPILVLVK